MPKTLQQELANGVTDKFKDAVVKKIDKDNYLDIHLPSIHPKKGTHIGINTAKGLIKIVFYCREESFNEKVLTNSKKIEAYAQGLRIKGNPTFNDVSKAVEAAIDFALEIKRASRNLHSSETKKSPKPKAAAKIVPKRIDERKNIIESREDDIIDEDSIIILRVGDKVNTGMFKKTANIRFWFGEYKEKVIKDISYSEEHEKYLALTADKKGNSIDYWDIEAISTQLADGYRFDLAEKEIEEEVSEEEEIADHYEIDEEIEQEEEVENVTDLSDFDITDQQLVNSISTGIKKGKCLTNLLYINKALATKGYDVDNHQTYFFDSSVLISDRELEGFLVVNMDGFYSNCLNEDEMNPIFSWSGVNDIEYGVDGEDCSIDIVSDQGILTIKKQGCHSLKILFTFYKFVWRVINERFKDQSFINWNDVWDMGISEVGFENFKDYCAFKFIRDKSSISIEAEEEIGVDDNSDLSVESTFYIGKSYQKYYVRFEEISIKTGILINKIKIEPSQDEREELWNIVRAFADRIYQLDVEPNPDKKELSTLCFYTIVALHWCDISVSDKRFSYTNGRFRRDTIALALCFYARIDRSYDYYDHVKLLFIIPHMQFSVLLWSINSIVNLGQDNLFGMFTPEQAQKAQQLFTQMSKENQESGGHGYVDPRKMPDNHPLKALWHEVISLFTNIRIPYQFIKSYISLKLPKRSFLQVLLLRKENNNPGVNVTLLDLDMQKNIAFLDKQIQHKQFPADWNLYDDLAYVYIYFATSDGNLSKEEKEKIIKLIGEWIGEEDEMKLDQYVNASIEKAKEMFDQDYSEERFSFALENIRRHFYVKFECEVEKTKVQLRLICNDLIQIAKADDIWENEESKLFEAITNEWGVRAFFYDEED